MPSEITVVVEGVEAGEDEAAEIVVETVVVKTSRPTSHHPTTVAVVAVTVVKDSVVPNIRIFQLVPGQGALCTSAGVEGLIFVVSHPPALGKTSILQSLQNETGASSATAIVLQ